jgi:hypothetical protein
MIVFGSSISKLYIQGKVFPKYEMVVVIEINAILEENACDLQFLSGG